MQAYDEYKKIEIEDDGKFKVNSRAVAMRHRLQIGTIVSDAVLQVKYLKGGFIGSVEEWFISKLSPGDVFTFAGKNLELYRIKGMQVLVKKAKTKKQARVVSWMGGRLTLSAQMSELLREELYSANLPFDQQTRELQALKDIFDRQRLESIVPNNDQFLIETFKSREGFHHIFYPFEGRFVHEALGSLLAYRISLLSPITFSIAFNDYGFEILSDQEIDMQQVLDNDLFTSEFLFEDLQRSLNSTEMARRKFRDIAVIERHGFYRFSGKIVKNKHLQSNRNCCLKFFGIMNQKIYYFSKPTARLLTSTGGRSFAYCFRTYRKTGNYR